MQGFIGEIRLFGGNFAPKNWVFCDGSMMNINDHQTFYSIIGTQFGGDGRTTFQLPELRGRTAVSPGGQWHQGLLGGAEQVKLPISQIPVHTHKAVSQLSGKLRCNDNLADHTSPVGNTLGKFKDNVDVYNSNQPDADMHDNTAVIGGSVNIGTAGGSTPHPNMQPSLAVNYIICVNGLYPQRS